MNFADQYLGRQNHMVNKTAVLPTILPKYCVVIPCYNEDKLTDTLNSIWQCNRTTHITEVLVVINSPASASEEVKKQNRKTFVEASEWIAEHHDNGLFFTLIFEPELPDKHAGAGLGRKIGMDMAVGRFNAHNKPDGLIVSLDADCIVEKNYLASIIRAFEADPQAGCATIYFEHPVEGNDYDKIIYDAITQYELHLRYHIGFLRHIDFPYAYHTIGSGFAVKALTYIRQGGMNTRKAGEDFYFLHKIFPVSRTIEINSTAVFPSPRQSSRVPYGTGPAIRKYTGMSIPVVPSYNPAAYFEIEKLLKTLPKLFLADMSKIKKAIEELPDCIHDFLNTQNAAEKIDEIKKNTGSELTFTKRFFSWFNSFMAVKYLNYAHKTKYQYIPVKEAVIHLFNTMDITIHGEITARKLLDMAREIQRSASYISPL